MSIARWFLVVAGLVLAVMVGVIVAANVAGGTAVAQVPFGLSPTVDGDRCSCRDDGKEWPCRRARNLTAILTCNAVFVPQLICPADKGADCTLSARNTCPEPPVINVCYEGDRP